MLKKVKLDFELINEFNNIFWILWINNIFFTWVLRIILFANRIISENRVEKCILFINSILFDNRMQKFVKFEIIVAWFFILIVSTIDYLSSFQIDLFISILQIIEKKIRNTKIKIRISKKEYRKKK